MYRMSGVLWVRGVPGARAAAGRRARARGRVIENVSSARSRASTVEYVLNHASAHAASARAIAAVVVAARALETTLDQPEHAACVAPDMYMDMLDMSCALPSQFMATECSIAFCSAADAVPDVYMYL